MKVITFKDISDLKIQPKLYYEWVSDMILHKKKSQLPPKISMKMSEGQFCNIMPSIISTEQSGNIGGVKIVNRYPNRNPSLDSQIILMNMDTGDFLSIMDGNIITAMRTGAVAVHSINLFAKKDFKKISIMGLGNTARATLMILESVFPDREFDIKILKYKNQAEMFIKRFEKYKNLHFTVVDDGPSLISDSDVVISCVTYFAEDFCEDKYFNEGVLLVPVHTRGFANCDLFFDKIYGDDFNHIKDFKNFSKFKSFCEVSDVVNGISIGRENDKERILAYNIGVSIHDINFAAHIYQLLKNKSGLKEIDMEVPQKKMWV